MTGIKELKTEKMLPDLLIEYEVEGYGETAPFLIKSGQLAESQVSDRKSRSGMPKEYVYKSGNDFKWNFYPEDTIVQKKIANAFVMNFDTFKKEGRGLYIYSKTKGSGKTLLSCCLANEVLKTNDISVKYISMTEYIELQKMNNKEEKEDKVNSLLNCSLLIVDDIGATTYEKEWISEVIYRLVNRRYENILPTIYTSNVSIDKLKCDERIKSRIEQVAIPVAMPEHSVRSDIARKLNKEFLNRVLA